MNRLKNSRKGLRRSFVRLRHATHPISLSMPPLDSASRSGRVTGGAAGCVISIAMSSSPHAAPGTAVRGLYFLGPHLVAGMLQKNFIERGVRERDLADRDA